MAQNRLAYGLVIFLNVPKGDDDMNITLLRSDEIYKKMMNSPKEKGDDIYPYEMAKPFELRWSCYNVPLRSSKKGGYDVVVGLHT